MLYLCILQIEERDKEPPSNLRRLSLHAVKPYDLPVCRNWEEVI